MKRILVVEDEPTILAAVASRLHAEEFLVDTAVDGPSAVDAAAACPPDLVVLDIMLPGFDGLEECRRIQAVQSIPVLMLTARSDETDMLIGLGIGADDYLTKPFSMRELVARVRVLLRRMDRTGPAQPVWVGDHRIDLQARRVHKGNDEIHLTRTEFDLLVFLAGRPPEWNLLEVFAHTVVFGIVLCFVLFGAYLVRFAPKLDALAPRPVRPVPNWEWAVPLAVLDVLFIGFVVVQATVLFGGHEHVLETDGLTYAEYARQGFWQLLWVSALTLLVLSAVIRVAGRKTAADRRLLRILVGILCATSVVVVVSAIHRMWLYQQAYGFSVQRLMVITIELWLGAVFILVAVAGFRMAGRWLPRAILIAGAVALLGLAATNPERLIAERNIDRYEQTGVLDTAYLLRLSPDIEPALARLPESMRVCATYRDDEPGPWYEFNLSRWRAPHDSTPSGDECAQYAPY